MLIAVEPRALAYGTSGGAGWGKRKRTCYHGEVGAEHRGLIAIPEVAFRLAERKTLSDSCWFGE